MKRAILNEQFLNGYIINENAPIGTIQQYAKNCPNGFVNCNGQSLSRTNYNRLFEIIGTTYGADDEATFKVPLITDKALLNVEYMTGKRHTNGKPIYHIEITEPNAGTWQEGTVIANISNFAELTLTSTMWYLANYGYVSNYDNSVGCYVAPNGTAKLVCNNSQANRIYPITIILEYTKTTDTENTFCYNQLAGSNFCIKATDYTQTTEDILDDSKITTGNVLSAAKVVEMNSYSTEEIKTEYRWVDNKPIYRKVFIDPNNSWSTSDNIIGNIADFKEPITIKAIACDASLMGYVENNGCGNARCYAYVKGNGEVHFYRYDIADGTIYPKRVIIEYTKTTD